MNIKELRESLKLSQPAFAKAIGAGISSIGAYELGTRRPSDKVLAKIKEVYGVDLDTPAAKAAPAKKVPAAKAAPAEEKKQPAKKAPAKKRAGKKAGDPQIIIQSPLGGEITPFAIMAKVGQVDKVYIRVDLNKAFWVKGTETGSVDLW